MSVGLCCMYYYHLVVRVAWTIGLFWNERMPCTEQGMLSLPENLTASFSVLQAWKLSSAFDLLVLSCFLDSYFLLLFCSVLSAPLVKLFSHATALLSILILIEVEISRRRRDIAYCHFGRFEDHLNIWRENVKFQTRLGMLQKLSIVSRQRRVTVIYFQSLCSISSGGFLRNAYNIKNRHESYYMPISHWNW